MRKYIINRYRSQINVCTALESVLNLYIYIYIYIYIYDVIVVAW